MAAHQEQRQFGRRQSRLHGWICVEGRESVPCLIINLSTRGAFLTCRPPSWLPFQFRLDIPFCNMTELCEIRHLRPDGVGITFHAREQPLPERAEPLPTEDTSRWIGEGKSRPPRIKAGPRDLQWPSKQDAKEIRLSVVRTATSNK